MGSARVSLDAGSTSSALTSREPIPAALMTFTRYFPSSRLALRPRKTSGLLSCLAENSGSSGFSAVTVTVTVGGAGGSVAGVGAGSSATVIFTVMLSGSPGSGTNAKAGSALSTELASSALRTWPKFASSTRTIQHVVPPLRK